MHAGGGKKPRTEHIVTKYGTWVDVCYAIKLAEMKILWSQNLRRRGWSRSLVH